MSKPDRSWTFQSFEAIVRWLCETRWGLRALRDALFSGHAQQHYNEWAQRARPTRIVVELFPDGYFRVYGEKRVYVRVIQRPIAIDHDNNDPKVAGLIDELMALQLPGPYQEVYCPSLCRADGKPELVTIRQLAAKEAKRDLELRLLQTLNEVCCKLGSGGRQVHPEEVQSQKAVAQ